MIAKVIFRPHRSDTDAQKNRPRMLIRLSRPVNPAAMVAMRFSCSPFSSCQLRSSDSSLPAKISCSIGEAIPRIPIPAVTLSHSTIHRSQICGVRQATRTCTWIVGLLRIVFCAFSPEGCQPMGGRR